MACYVCAVSVEGENRTARQRDAQPRLSSLRALTDGPRQPNAEENRLLRELQTGRAAERVT